MATDPTAAWKNPAYRLARRIGYGPTPDEATKANQLGAKGYLEYQLNFNNIDDSLCYNLVNKLFPRLKMTPYQLQKLDGWVSRNMLMDATLYRMLYSKRQLVERMVEFWREHFSVFFDKCGPEMMLPWDTKVIRQYAMTNFQQLLFATATNANMMRFLDNESSNSANPNQNYARELMELHTLGVDGGYTQQDVEEVARCLTGWGINYDSQSWAYLTFQFNAWAHDTGSKTVLGHKIPAGGGLQDGITVLRILANHPSTANHVCTKLIRFFLGMDPDPAHLKVMTTVFLKSGGDVKSLLRALFNYDVTKTPAKFKRPAHLIASAIRLMHPTTFTLSGIGEIRDYYLETTNDLPYYWSPPNGYPDETGYWSGNMLERWNFAFDLSSNATNTIRYDSMKLIARVASAPLNAGNVSAGLSKLFCLGEMADGELQDLKSHYLAAAPIQWGRLEGAIALTLNSPSFQYF